MLSDVSAHWIDVSQPAASIASYDKSGVCVCVCSCTCDLQHCQLPFAINRTHQTKLPRRKRAKHLLYRVKTNYLKEQQVCVQKADLFKRKKIDILDWSCMFFECACSSFNAKLRLKCASINTNLNACIVCNLCFGLYSFFCLWCGHC